jgi:hypothetical protein
MKKMKENVETPWSTLAEVRKMFDESDARFDRRMKESNEKYAHEKRKSEEQYAREKRESEEQYAREEKERDEKFARGMEELREAIRQVNKQIGGMANSDGACAEEFFYNALKHGQKKLFGEEFEDVIKNNKVTINKGYEDEYDILLVNGQAICVVEVKYKADSSDLAQKVLRKAETFRVNFPQHKEKRVYLALAGMSFNPLTEKACFDNGIAIIKQVGDTVVINDHHFLAS